MQILRHPGYNMALWNLHERRLTCGEGTYKVNDAHDLVFYHFSGVLGKRSRIENDYSRFSGDTRADLAGIYNEYRAALSDSSFSHFSAKKCFYSHYHSQPGTAASTDPASRPVPAPLKKLIKRGVGRVTRWAGITAAGAPVNNSGKR